MPPNTQTTNDIDPPRHVRLRGRRGGFAAAGAANSTHSESLRTAAEEDEVDSLTDPEAMRDHVVSTAQQRTPLPPPRMQPLNAPDPVEDDTGFDITSNPRERLNQVALGASAGYTREYRLQLIGKMLMRNLPLDVIAQQFQVSVSTIEKDRAEIKSRMRQRARDMDINEFIGGQSELYDEISSMSLRVASSNAPTPMKLAAMRTTLAANADRTRMLQSTGVMDVLRYRRAATEGELSDVQLLMQRTAEMLDVLNAPTSEPEPAPVKPTRVKRTPPRAGGFKPFSMDDSDASNSSNETVEL